MSETEINNQNEGAEETNSRVYELGYLFVPTISEENLSVVYGNLRELILAFGGLVISEEAPKLINLAYTMAKVISNVRMKFDNGYFGWIKFTMDTEKVLELKRKLDQNHDLIRFLILKTVRENTLAAKKVSQNGLGRKTNAPKGESVDTGIPINKEEIDKEIDALVESN